MTAGRPPEPRTHSRIVVAASSFADASSGVRLAALLSARIEADLQGVFIEGETGDLFRSPAARIVSTTGALLALPSPEEMRATLKREAHAFESEIARIAQSHARPWSFRTIQGRLFGRLDDLLQARDILLLGHRPLLRLRGPVVRLGKTGHPDIAAGLAADLGVPLVTVPVTDDRTEQEETLEMIGRTSATAIVIDTEAGPLRTPEQIEALLEAARCPVILVGAPLSGGG
jgi:hypothetical protein